MTKTPPDHKNKDALWGIDLGGTKIEGVILQSSATPDILFRERIATEADKGYQHILNQIKIIVDVMISRAGYTPDCIGFATPGTLDPKLGVMKNCNTVAMNGQRMKEDLERVLGLQAAVAAVSNHQWPR